MEKIENYAISEEALCRHAAGGRSGKPADGSDGEHGKARGPLWRQIPDYRFPAVELRQLQD